MPRLYRSRRTDDMKKRIRKPIHKYPKNANILVKDLPPLKVKIYVRIGESAKNARIKPEITFPAVLSWNTLSIFKKT